jgi:hypothetical protein
MKTWLKEYKEEFNGAFESFLKQDIEMACQLITKKLMQANVFIIGNGGSAAIAQHFATDWSVQQFNPNGADVIREFSLKNCWPIGVGQLPLSMNEDNQLGAFSVTILFSHYTVTKI